MISKLVPAMLKGCLCPAPSLVPWRACLLEGPLRPALWHVSGLSSGPISIPLYWQARPSLALSRLIPLLTCCETSLWSGKSVPVLGHPQLPPQRKDQPFFALLDKRKERKKCVSLWWVRRKPVKMQAKNMSVHAEEFLGFAEQHTSSLWQNDSRKWKNVK